MIGSSKSLQLPDAKKKRRPSASRKVQPDDDWRPWGLYDDKSIPPFSDAAISRALAELKVSDDIKPSVRKRIEQVAQTYWRIRRDVERPGSKWYRSQVKPVRTATAKLLKVIRPRGRTALVALNYIIRDRMQRSLWKRGQTFDSPQESIEQLLEDLIRACDHSLKVKGTPGNKKTSHVRSAALQAADIWLAIAKKPVPLSFDTCHDEKWEFGPSRDVFIQSGPRFVQLVLQGIDPKISVAQIVTALRSITAKQKLQKSGTP
jgi:hypothetical protein